MRSMILFVPLVVLASAAPAQPATQAAQTKKELTTLFAKVVDAVQHRDTVTLTRIYAPEYSFVIGGGDSVTSLTRAERLQSIAASTDSISTLNLERCEFSVFALVAFGDCWIRQRNVVGPSSEWTGIFTTVVFTRASGRWRLVRSHASVNRHRRP